jgi:hypothetical protein
LRNTFSILVDPDEKGNEKALREVENGLINTFVCFVGGRQFISTGI